MTIRRWAVGAAVLIAVTPMLHAAAAPAPAKAAKLAPSDYTLAFASKHAPPPTPTPEPTLEVRAKPKLAADESEAIWSAESTGAHPTQVTMRADTDETSPAYTLDGTRLAYVQTSSVTFDRQVMAADGDGGNPVSLTGGWGHGRANDPSWSPDGTKIALSWETTGTNTRIVVVRVADGRKLGEVPSGTVGDFAPSWSPDGTKIAFARQTNSGGEHPVSTRHIWTATVEFGADDAMTVTGQHDLSADIDAEESACNVGGYDTDPAWSPDGGELAFVGFRQICVLNPLNGFTRVPFALPTGGWYHADPAWSPDGAVIAFTYDLASPGLKDWLASEVWAGPAAGGSTKALVEATPDGLAFAADPAYRLVKQDWMTVNLTVEPQPGCVGGKPVVARFTVFGSSRAWIRDVKVTVSGPGGPAVLELGTLEGAASVGGAVTLPAGVAVTGTVTGVVTGKLANDQVVTVSTSAPARIHKPALAAAPTQGPPGSAPHITGTDYPPGAVVHLAWDKGTSPPVDVVATADGSFTAQLLFDKDEALGKRVLTATTPACGPLTVDYTLVAGQQLAITVEPAPQPGCVGGKPVVVTYTLRNNSPEPLREVRLTVAAPGVPAKMVEVGLIPPWENRLVDLAVPAAAANGPATGSATGFWLFGERQITVTAAGQAPVRIYKPVLTVQPGVRIPGTVVQASLADAPPGTSVKLAWSRGLSPGATVTAAADGTGKATLLLLHHDQTGARVLTGTSAACGPVTAGLLVVPGAQDPSKYVVRR